MGLTGAFSAAYGSLIDNQLLLARIDLHTFTLQSVKHALQIAYARTSCSLQILALCSSTGLNIILVQTYGSTKAPQLREGHTSS